MNPDDSIHSVRGDGKRARRCCRMRLDAAAWLAAGVGTGLLLLAAGIGIDAGPDAPPWTQFPGRFHPLVVHFPIAAILMALGFDLAERRSATALRTSTLALLWIGTLSAFAAVVLGTLLAAGGGYGEELLWRHRGSGLAVAFLAWAALGLKLAARAEAPARAALARVCTAVLLAANGVLVYASHQGGSLTHGSTYLTEYAPEFVAFLTGRAPRAEPQIPVEERLLFDHLVLPVLEKNCITCHGPEKSKGDLRLDSHAAVLAGGIHGPAFTAGELADGPLLERVRLPETDRRAMPPMGRPRLSEAEIDVLEWYIASGAGPDTRWVDADLPEHIQTAAGVLARDARDSAGPSADERRQLDEHLARLRDRGFTILPATEIAEERYTVTAFEVIGTIDDEDLEALLPLSPYIVELNLARSRVTDEGTAALLMRFQQLRVLRLDQTEVGDQTLRAAMTLPALREAGFHSTRVGDGAIPSVVNAPQLRFLHLWNTGATTQAVQAVRTKAPEVEITL